MLDNERAGRMGVEHLYENGYRRIEMISYTLGISSLSERERGYCEAMRRYGLEGYSQIHYTVYGHAQEDTVRIFEDAVRRGVEAFLLPTNTLALLGLQALNALNLSAPEDLALVGFDESEIFSLYKPSVTYITQSTRRLGEQSFEMLRRMIAGDDDCRSVVIEPELIVGGSTACIHPERVEAGREHAAGVAELTPRDSVLLPGTYFRHKGGWTADPQFMEQMGSSYLLAHGLGTPVEDAVTKIEIPQSGPVPHLRADEELDSPLGRQGEACPRRLPPPHRRPRLRHALRYGRSRMALAGGRYDLPYGGRPPSRAARSGGIRRALRRHPLHAARRGARRFARNGLPAAQQPARPARRTRRAGDVRFRRRGRRRGRHVRRHCGGTAGVARGADPGPQGVGRQQLVGGARRAGRPAQYRRLPVVGLSAQ